MTWRIKFNLKTAGKFYLSSLNPDYGAITLKFLKDINYIHVCIFFSSNLSLAWWKHYFSITMVQTEDPSELSLVWSIFWFLPQYVQFSIFYTYHILKEKLNLLSMNIIYLKMIKAKIFLSLSSSKGESH